MKRNRKFFSILLFTCLITLLFSTVYAAIISLTSVNEDLNIDSISTIANIANIPDIPDAPRAVSQLTKTNIPINAAYIE